VSERLDELPGSASVALVTFAERGVASAYRRRNGLRYPVLVDPDRQAYRAFGLGRGSIRRVWGLRALRRYIEVIRADGFSDLHRPTDDTLQLGGDFVVDPEGRLVWAFWGEGPDDRPSVDALIAATAAAVNPV
jgi:hypothetical protein